MLLAPTATGTRTAVDADSRHCSADPAAPHPPPLAGGRGRRGALSGCGDRAEHCPALSVLAHPHYVRESPRRDQLPPSAARGDQPLRASVTGAAGRAAVADQDDGNHLRGGRLAAAQAERPPGPGRRAVGAQGRRRPRRHPGRVPRLAVGKPARRLPDWRPGRLTGLWRALFDEQPELEAAVAAHLEETTCSFNRRIKGWIEHGSVQRSDIEDLLQ